MDYISLLRAQFNNQLALVEKRPNILQLVAPLYHEDGDMVDLFLDTSERSDHRVRICDFGMTLMRLSYNYELDTPNKERIFHRIITENRVSEDNGNLYLDAEPERLYPSVLQFAQTVGKVANMQLYRREVVQSLFYELLQGFVEESLAKYSPQQNMMPIADRDDLEVDWQFNIGHRAVYLFGVRDSAKARLATISCLEFQRAGLSFSSMVVHDDFDNLPKKDRSRITSAADKQFVSLDDFRTRSLSYLDRLSQSA